MHRQRQVLVLVVALTIPLALSAIGVLYVAAGGLERDLEQAWSEQLNMPGTIAIDTALLAGFGDLQLSGWQLADDAGHPAARFDTLHASRSDNGRLLQADIDRLEIIISPDAGRFWSQLGQAAEALRQRLGSDATSRVSVANGSLAVARDVVLDAAQVEFTRGPDGLLATVAAHVFGESHKIVIADADGQDDGLVLRQGTLSREILTSLWRHIDWQPPRRVQSWLGDGVDLSGTTYRREGDVRWLDLEVTIAAEVSPIARISWSTPLKTEDLAGGTFSIHGRTGHVIAGRAQWTETGLQLLAEQADLAPAAVLADFVPSAAAAMIPSHADFAGTTLTLGPQFSLNLKSTWDRHGLPGHLDINIAAVDNDVVIDVADYVDPKRLAYVGTITFAADAMILAWSHIDLPAVWQSLLVTGPADAVELFTALPQGFINFRDGALEQIKLTNGEQGAYTEQRKNTQHTIAFQQIPLRALISPLPQPSKIGGLVSGKGTAVADDVQLVLDSEPGTQLSIDDRAVVVPGREWLVQRGLDSMQINSPQADLQMNGEHLQVDWKLGKVPVTNMLAGLSLRYQSGIWQWSTEPAPSVWGQVSLQGEGLLSAPRQLSIAEGSLAVDAHLAPWSVTGAGLQIAQIGPAEELQILLAGDLDGSKLAIRYHPDNNARFQVKWASQALLPLAKQWPWLSVDKDDSAVLLTETIVTEDRPRLVGAWLVSEQDLLAIDSRAWWQTEQLDDDDRQYPQALADDDGESKAD